MTKSVELRNRELMLKLHAEGKTQEYIASLLGCSQQKVSFWLKRFESSNNLSNKHRSGRPTVLSVKKTGEIKDIIANEMIKRSADNCSMNSKEIKDVIKKDTGKIYSLRHVQRLLHKMGFERITPQIHHIKRDVKAQEAFKDEFKKNFNKSMWTISS
jgi:transposase